MQEQFLLTFVTNKKEKSILDSMNQTTNHLLHPESHLQKDKDFPLQRDVTESRFLVDLLALNRDDQLQNSAEPGDLGKGIASLMFSIPVANCTSLSKPNPNPACGTEHKIFPSIFPS